MKRVDECIQQYEFLEQEVLTGEQKRIFRIAYNMGTKDTEQEILGEKRTVTIEPVRRNGIY